MTYCSARPGRRAVQLLAAQPRAESISAKELGFSKIDYRVDPDRLGPLGFFNAFR